MSRNKELHKMLEQRSICTRKRYQELVDKMDSDTSKAVAEFVRISGSRVKEIKWLKIE